MAIYKQFVQLNLSIGCQIFCRLDGIFGARLSCDDHSSLSRQRESDCNQGLELEELCQSALKVGSDCEYSYLL
jgi:hypothetical protein